MRKKTKGIVAFGLSASMVLALIPHMNTYADTETLDVVKQSEFADKNLYARVKQAGDTNGDGILTREEAENITYLNCVEYENIITDYTGLGILKNLTSADLYINDDKSVGNFIDNVYDKSKITIISVDGQSISEEQFNRIAELENLTSLNVSLKDGSIICNPDLKFNDKLESLKVESDGNFSADYPKYFKSLNELIITAGTLTDVNRLYDYDNLHRLCINASELDNTIKAPDNLNTLEVAASAKVDLSNLDLGWLDLRGCSNVDIDRIEQMNKLYHLELSNCTISKEGIDFKSNEAIRSIDLIDLKLKNVTGLKDKNIETVRINNTFIETAPDIPESVRGLDLACNKITDIPDWSSADFDYFYIRNNNLTLDKVKGKIPEKYESDIEWITQNIYYKNNLYEQLPSEYIYNNIKRLYDEASDDNPYIHDTYYVSTDKVILNSDFVKYVSDKNIEIDFKFLNKYIDNKYYYMSDYYIEECKFKSSDLDGYIGDVIIDFSNWNVTEADKEISDSYKGNYKPFVYIYNPHTGNDVKYLEYNHNTGFNCDVYGYYGNGIYENIGKNISYDNVDYVINRNGNSNIISYFMTEPYDDSVITDEKDKLSSPEIGDGLIEDISGFINNVEDGSTIVVSETNFDADTWNKMIDKKLKCIFVSNQHQYQYSNIFSLSTDYQNMIRADSDVYINGGSSNNFNEDVFSKDVHLTCGGINRFTAKMYVGDIFRNGEVLVDNSIWANYISHDWTLKRTYCVDPNANQYIVESGYIRFEGNGSGIWKKLQAVDDLTDLDTVDKAPEYRKESGEDYSTGDEIYTKGGDRIKSIDLNGLYNGMTIHCNVTVNDVTGWEYLVAMDTRGKYEDGRDVFGIGLEGDRFLVRIGQTIVNLNTMADIGKTYDIYTVIEEDDKYTILTIYIDGKLVDKLRHYSAENGMFTQSFVKNATEYDEFGDGASFKEIDKKDLTALYLETSYVSSDYIYDDVEHKNVLNSYEILAGRSVPKDFKDIEMGDATPGDATPGEPETPTEAPTEKPTEKPTEAPTEKPTEAPTENPTEAPTVKPVVKPTESAKPEVVDKKEVVDHEKVVENIKDKLVTTKNTKKVDVVTNKAPVISADTFKLVDNNSKNLTVGVVDDNNQLQYSWTFAASEIKDTTKDVDLTITFDSDRQEKIEKLTGETDSLYINFAYHGNLPGTSTVKLYVGNKYGNNEKVYIYYYDEEEDKVLMVGRKPLTVKDGYVEFSITHCSTYFLSETKYNVEQDKSSLDDATVRVGTDSEDVPTGDNTSKICYMLAIIILCFVGIIVVADTKATKLSRQKE